TERTMLAMPETGLGLFPDVGGGWFLPRLDGEVGMYLALTGDRVKASDCEGLGITNGYLTSDRLPAFMAALMGAETLDHAIVDALLAEFAVEADGGNLAAVRGEIDACFGVESVEGIFAALEQDGGEWALKTLGRLKKKSPTSMKVTFRQMRYGRAMGDIRDNMVMEYRIARHTLQGHDFYEGVRALLIDKDMAPTWQPAAFEDVTDAMVDSHFAPFGDDDLSFE
ncbi:MAG: enoyl-CoA hydratase/isomerase family protein, partial [Sphingomonadales bacterium]|nr:enoyl-CoA hydratase/isomerase family protein [Sphingomonadales bacterium]